MKVFIPPHSSFCPGIKSANSRIFEWQEKRPSKDIYILGHMIHNRRYCDYLKARGIQTVENTGQIPPGSLAVIRTHGIDRRIEAALRDRFEVLDLTCTKVKRLQRLIRKYSMSGYFTIIVGKKTHPEIISLVSYAERYYVVENETDLTIFLNNASLFLDTDETNYKNIFTLSQTTGNRSLFEKTIQALKDTFKSGFNVQFLDSFCSNTSLREKESLAIQKEVDVTLVIGDALSSNAKKLYEILKNNNKSTFFIQDLDDLIEMNLPLSRYGGAQVVSSSSTPPFIEKEIADYLENLD